MLALSSPWRFESSSIKLKALVPKDEVRLGFDLFNERNFFRMCPTHSRFGLSRPPAARLHSVRISFRRSFRSVSSSRATSGDSRVRAHSLARSFRFPLSFPTRMSTLRSRTVSHLFTSSTGSPIRVDTVGISRSCVRQSDGSKSS